MVLIAKFFRDDLPYFVEVLNEVTTQTKYLGKCPIPLSFGTWSEPHFLLCHKKRRLTRLVIDYEFTEQVMDHIHRSQHLQLSSPSALAQASAHSLAFHRGLGEPVHPTSATPLSRYLSHDAIAAYSTLAYRKSNVAVVANGAEHTSLQKWVSEFFADMRTQPVEGIPPLEGTDQTKYYGGEERIAHGKSNAMVLAFPGSSSLTGGFYKPEVAVLAALLGGRSSIKWSPGFSLLSKAAAQTPKLEIDTSSAIYSDAGLLQICISSSSAAHVRDGAEAAVETMKRVANNDFSEEDFEKARAQARFKELEYGQEMLAGLELSGAGLLQGSGPYQLDESAERIGKVERSAVTEAAKGMLEFKACVSTVGDLWQLPYAEEMNLNA